MEKYFTRQEAVALCESFERLNGMEFIHPKTSHHYKVYFIVPVPASKEEIEEFRDLIYNFFQTQDLSAIKDFNSKHRQDNFIPILFAKTDIGADANILSISLNPYVREHGLLKCGFPVTDDLILF